MSNYTQITFFAPKDLLLSGNPAKLIKGADIDPELNGIAVAIATKYDSSSIASAPILFAAGTASLPGIAFTGGTNNNTGMFLSAANQLGLSANGIQGLGIDTAGSVGMLTPTAAASVFGQQVGYLETPVNIQSVSYTLVMGDRGKLLQMNAGTTVTVPANASVAFPVGTTILVSNLTGVSISVTTADALSWQTVGNVTNGTTRTLAEGGVMTLVKRASTTWAVWGFGIS